LQEDASTMRYGSYAPLTRDYGRLCRGDRFDA
jgi:hypothetical protein